MSFETYEESRYHGEPVDLYQFIYGSGENDYLAYCDAEEAITVAGVVYEPIPIMRTPITSSGTLDKATITVTADNDTELAALFRVYPPTQTVTMFIRQGHVGDSEFFIVWTGRILGAAFEDSEVKLTCEPVSTSMKRTGLRRNYQYGCPHALYMGNEKGGCRANKVAATRSVTVAAVSTAKITLPDNWFGVFNPAKFRNGLVEWRSNGGAKETRTILRVAGNVLSIGGTTRDLDAGDTVKVILGCDHTMVDCKELHNNLLDFGGQPWIPKKSPFGSVNNYW
jgi:Phage conserved hypothetical protein BR0599